MFQRGKLCMYVEVDIPCDLQVVANKLIQDGHVLSADYVDSYKVDLKDYIINKNNDVSLNINNISTYMVFAEKFTSSFIKNIILAPSSLLESPHYDFHFHFGKNNKIKLIGVIWPTLIQSKNLIGFDLSLSEQQKLEIRQNYLDIIDQCVTTSSNEKYLRSKFNMTENDAKITGNLALENQNQICKVEIAASI